MIHQRFLRRYLFSSLRKPQEYQYFKQRPHQSYQDKRILYFAGGSTFLFGVYYVSHLETVPLSGRTRFMNVSPQEEISMSKSAYQAIMNQHKHKLLPQTHPYTMLVRKVSQRLIQKSQMNNVEWEVNVIESLEANAFVLPNGKIFVYTGILKLIENESQLATVLSHEICHVFARHTAEKLSFLKLAMYTKLLLSVFIGSDAANILFNPLFFNLGFNLPFSRKCEDEADQIGLILMAGACYDPSQSTRFWAKMSDVHKQKGNLPSFLSTHPDPQQRIQRLRENMSKARDEYHRNDCDFDGQQIGSIYNSFRDFTGVSSAYRW